MKRTLKRVASFALFLSFLLVLLAGGAMAEDDDWSVKFLPNGTLCIIGYHGADLNVTIPASIGGRTVTQIGNEAFKNDRLLTAITIPDSVISIGSGAFYGCNELVEITFGSGLKWIDDQAFRKCTALTTVQLPEGLQYLGCTSSDGGANGGGVFKDCKSLKKVYIPSTLKACGDSSYGGNFEGCTKLTDVSFGKKIKLIPNDLFYKCFSLTEITIPSTVTEIGNRAFYSCSGLTKIKIPNNVTGIGSAAFYGCTSLTGVTFGLDLTWIDDQAFRNCTSLTSAVLPEGLLYLGCTSSKDDSRGGGVFMDCTALKSVYIPSTLKACGDSYYGGNFEGCAKLAEVEIGSGIKNIPEDLFYRCTGLTEITIPSSATAIKSYAFYGCSGLTQITFSNSVTSIGDKAFKSCDALSDVYFSGAEADWAILRDNAGSDNDALLNAAVHYTSAISSDPDDVTTTPGSTVTFTVAAANAESYQWQASTDKGKTWANSGANGSKTPTLSFTSAAAHDGYLFRCVVTGGGASVASSAAKLTVSPGPAITGQPTDKTVSAGSAVSFSVTATGSGLTYQWQASSDGGKTWANSGANGNKTATLSFTAATAHNGYMFRCKVTNKDGSAVTNAAKLTVSAGPVITSQPADVSVSVGAAATFKVTATGATSYQWQASTDGGKTWVNSGANGSRTATLSFTAAAAHNGYMFRCIVKNSGGSTASGAAKLTVAATVPTITAQPSSVSVTAGSAATFKVTASGATSYQWQASTDGGKTWANSGASGSKTATLSFTAAAAHNGYMFRCKVTGSGGSVTSSAAKLTVTAALPTITAQPSSVSVSPGSTATFKVTASGSGLSYQWQASTDGGKTWANSGASGSKTATLSFTAAAAHNGYMFRCVVKGSGGNITSEAAKLTVAGPTITGQPSNKTVSAGATATFTVTASGATSYQWQASTDGGKTWVNSGANGSKTATLSFTAAAAHNGYMFRCIVTGNGGSAVTNAVKLTVS